MNEAMPRNDPWSLVLGFPIALLLAILFMVAIQAQFLVLWRPLYAHPTWKGYEIAAERGYDVPFYTTSPRALLATEMLLFLFALALLLIRRSFWPLVVPGLLIGAFLGAVGVWISTRRLREDSNLWPIDMLFLLVVTAVSIALGSGLAVAVRVLVPKLRHHASRPASQ
jgi:hypothetical protein